MSRPTGQFQPASATDCYAKNVCMYTTILVWLPAEVDNCYRVLSACRWIAACDLLWHPGRTLRTRPPWCKATFRASGCQCASVPGCQGARVLLHTTLCLDAWVACYDPSFLLLAQDCGKVKWEGLVIGIQHQHQLRQGQDCLSRPGCLFFACLCQSGRTCWGISQRSRITGSTRILFCAAYGQICW